MIQLANHSADSAHPWHGFLERAFVAHIEVYALVGALIAIAGLAVIH